ncbi:MAG: hypothetical protein ABGW99_01970 [Zunongwangia sp.]|uniref:hypothetical protein n=1 Tax=Zunongwangia sp. TaxID=1965325 RepID=UPI00324281E7
MKSSIFILFFILCGLVTAQNYEEKFHLADSLVYAEADSIANAKKGYQLYTELYKEIPEKITFWNLYDLAYAANKFNDSEKGFYWLEKTLSHYQEEDAAYLIDADAQKELYNLVKSPQWKDFEQKVQTRIKNHVAEIKKNQRKLIEKGLGGIDFKKSKNSKALYQKLRSYKDYPEIPSEIFGFITLNDTLEDNYFARIPSGYQPDQPSKVLFFLNGAVRYQKIPSYPTTNLEEGWQRFYKKCAEKHNVIMVYPNCDKQFNWMLGDEGFAIVPKILQELKKFINIDDNQVYVAGHSNGATGSFSYAMKNPNPFASFYGMNTQPKVYTGGTFLKNLSNRSFYNISTDEDYYFPPNANDSLVILAEKLQLDFSDHRYHGFPHWFPQFDASEKAVKGIFKDLFQQERNPLSSKIYWECDDVNNGKIDWLAITEMDTLQPKTSWHNEVNFNIDKWLSYNENDSLVAKKVNQKAFDFPRKSAAVKANFEDNRFDIKTSRVGELSIYVSPEMVSMKKPILIYVNGKKVYEAMSNYDRKFLIKNFKKYYDRKVIWVEEIQIEL